MALNADLTVKLDASSLVETFLGELTGSSVSLNAIPNPTSADQLSTAGDSGGSFLTGAIREAIGGFASVGLPIPEIPGTLQRIEATLAAVEGFSTRDLGGDVTTLLQQLIAELERANEQGVPGTILTVADLLSRSPTWSALTPLLSVLTGGSQDVALPEAITDYLPAFASTVRVIAGLMVYETVLAEGERLTAIVSTLFNAERARRGATALQAAFQIGDRTLAEELASVDAADTARVEALIVAMETVAAQLASLDEYVSEGMGFGEATLVHFDVAAAQTDVATAATLLRDPDLGSLRRVVESLARRAQPIADLLDPGTAAARGMEGVLQLAEAQVAQAASAIRTLDASALVTPLTDGISALTSPLRDFSNLVAQLVTEVRAVLEQVRAAVAALPIDGLAIAIRSALEPVTEALQFLTRLVDDIREALEEAAGQALEALGEVEGVVDGFKQDILDLFAEARDFIDGLHLDQVVSAITDKVNEFVGLLQQAQMKPYFDTAASAIGAAADVVAAVPLDLLPESMKADLDTALAPVREVNADAVEEEIESLLQIGPDGTFQLRGDLEHALAAIQTKFEELLATLAEHHPSRYLDQIDHELAGIAEKIRALAPDLTLAPVQQAIAQIKSALGSFDLEQELQPVQQVFDNAIALLDQYSPAALIRPLEERVNEARQALVQAIRIDTWQPTLDDMAAQALEQLDVIDPAALGSLLQTLLGRLQAEIDDLPDIGFGNFLGSIVAGLMRGSSLRIGASSIGSVLRWVSGGASASSELSARAVRIGEALAAARSEVEGFDPGVLSASVAAATAVGTAAATLATKLTAGSVLRIRVEASAAHVDAGTIVGRLTANRTRYLELLRTAAALGDALGRTGMSEADVAVGQLQNAVEPLDPLFEKLRLLVSYLGIGGTQAGLGSVLRAVLGVATPARITGLVTPLISAVRDRLRTLIDEVLAPVRAAIADLQELIALFDLHPVTEGVDAVYQEVRTQLLAYSPGTLLREQLDAFAALKQDLLDFDPLGPILAVLNELRDTAARIIEKLSAHALLESPLAVYDTILNAIRPLNINTILTPVLEALDTIAQQVDEGLDETVDAFKRLQEALPAPGGGSSASVSVSVT